MKIDWKETLAAIGCFAIVIGFTYWFFVALAASI